VAATVTRRPVYQFGRAYRSLLTTTAATTVFTAYTGGRNRLLLFKGYASSTSATTVSITVSWTDPDTGAASYTYAAVNVAANGTASFTPPQVILAAAGSVVTVQATAGAANAVRVTVSLEGA
jgi:hypothetical protein